MGVKPVLMMFCMLLLFGCSSMSYKEPQTGPTAKVRFVSTLSEISSIRSYADKNCSDEKEFMRLRNGYMFSNTAKSLHMPLLANGLHEYAFKEVYMEANKEHVFMFTGGESNMNIVHLCGVMVNANFEEEKMYELEFMYTVSNCIVKVHELKVDSEGNYYKSLLNQYTNYVAGYGKECKEAYEKTRLY